MCRAAGGLIAGEALGRRARPSTWLGAGLGDGQPSFPPRSSDHASRRAVWQHTHHSLCCAACRPPRLDRPMSTVLYPSTSSLTISRQCFCWHKCWLAALKARPLFPRKTPCFRAGFKRLLGKIGAAPQEYKPYSLRRGGATHHWHVLGNLSRTTLRGRWRHQQTCRIYIQDGVAMLEQLRLSARELKLIAKGCALLRRLA